MKDLVPFQRAIVRITGENDQLHGVGLLLSPEIVLTCAHVVTDALGCERNTMIAPRGEVRLNLPFVGNESLAAEVLGNGWFPRNGEKLTDLALLRLRKPLVTGGYALLSPAFSLFGLRFQAWGGQEGHERNLVPVRGRLGREIANGRYLLDVQESNYKIRPGCSGAPVVDLENGLILGLIVQEELDESRAAGFLIPVSQMREALRRVGIAWQEVMERGLDNLLAWAKTRYRLRLRLQADVLRFIENYRDKPDAPRPLRRACGGAAVSGSLVWPDRTASSSAQWCGRARQVCLATALVGASHEQHSRPNHSILPAHQHPL